MLCSSAAPLPTTPVAISSVARAQRERLKTLGGGVPVQLPVPKAPLLARRGANPRFALSTLFAILQLQLLHPPLKLGDLWLAKMSSQPRSLTISNIQFEVQWRMAEVGGRTGHVTCYTAPLHLVDFKCASSFGEAQEQSGCCSPAPCLCKLPAVRRNSSAVHPQR